MELKKLNKSFFGNIGLFFVLALLFYGEANASVVFSDGNFADTDWSHKVYASGSGGSQTASQELAGGNPDSFLHIQNTVNTPDSITWVGGYFLKKGAVYEPSVSGAIQSVDYGEDAIMFSGFGGGQASFMVIAQADNIYFQFPYLGTNFGQWSQIIQKGLTAKNFVQFDFSRCNIEPACLNLSSHPDFSTSGATMTFGFGSANAARVGASGYTIDGGIDNWQVTINPVPLQKITCNGKAATIIGTGAPDIIVGTEGPDVIHGLTGNDGIDGRGGDDIICGGEGNDILLGGSGKNILLGGNGNDTLNGGDEEDSLYGSFGDDLLMGNKGSDLLKGEAGNDQLFGGNGNDKLFGEKGADSFDGGTLFDICNGGHDSDIDVYLKGCEFIQNIP